MQGARLLLKQEHNKTKKLIDTIIYTNAHSPLITFIPNI